MTAHLPARLSPHQHALADVMAAQHYLVCAERAVERALGNIGLEGPVNAYLARAQLRATLTRIKATNRRVGTALADLREEIGTNDTH